MENKEPSPPSPITTTEKKQNQKMPEELQLEKNLQDITKKQEKQKGESRS